MPVTVWPICRLPPDLFQDKIAILVLVTSMEFRHVNSGSSLFSSRAHTCRGLASTFPVTLTTKAFDLSSLRRFGISSCKAIPKGLPSSLVKRGLSPLCGCCLQGAPILFHLLVPGGKWQTLIARPVSSASACSCTFQRRLVALLEPPASAVTSRRLAPL